MESQRLYLLDIARGIASLVVVIFHYPIFFLIAPFTLPADFLRTSQPFYNALSLFYEEGSRAVQLFFVLSGFIFFFQYADSIRTGAVSASRFFVLRFSRLYPLHAATLIAVAIGQTISLSLDGQFIANQCNNWKRFIISSLLITDWLPAREVCMTFNGPAWSISVEMFLYVLFFIIVSRLPAQRWMQLFATLSVVVASIAIFKFDGYHLLGEPAFCFFSGGAACLIWRSIGNNSRSQIRMVLLSTLVVLLSAGELYYYGADQIVLGVVTYPSLVLLLATLQMFRSSSGKSFRLIGDISYSTYLIHFPIQLFLVLAVNHHLLKIDFYDRLAWLSFFAFLIVTSACSYHYFELPMQKMIRRSILPFLERRQKPTCSTTLSASTTRSAGTRRSDI